MLVLKVRPESYADQIIMELPDGRDILISVGLTSSCEKVKLSIDAPRDIKILRQSVKDRINDAMDDQVVS